MNAHPAGWTVARPAELSNLVGAEFVGQEWLTVDQGRIDAFAGATGDFQWIHVEPERAAAGPFGAPVAHGYLTLALIPILTEGLLDVGGVGAVVNYGFDRVRFVQPVIVGSRLRARIEVTAVDESGLGYRVAQRVTIDVEGSDRPALVAETIALLVAGMSGDATRTTPGIDVAAFGRWLAVAHPEWAGSAADEGGLTATRLAGGLSNLTYRIDGSARPLVLRRPPLGHVLSTAHDMQREFTIITALAGSAVPVPPALAYLDDADGAAGVGTPFYLMDFVAGPILSRPADNAGHSPAALRATSLDLARTLGELHSLDPVSVGLAEFGRPSGFVERQLRRWAAQYDASRSRDVAKLDTLQARLGLTRPETTRDSLLHGDFRLDNAIVHPDAGDGERIAAVLDWEMATIGDSLLDLGTFSMYWDFNEVTGGSGIGGSAVDRAAGYPEFDELVDVYSSVVGTTVPPLGWYRAFAAYKLAVILEGIHLRFSSGQTVGPGFEQVGSFVVPLAEWGLAQLDATG